MSKPKIYHSFQDIYGNQYGFNSYMEFASFWFDIPRRRAVSTFPEFRKLQNAAANSKEARTKVGGGAQ